MLYVVERSDNHGKSWKNLRNLFLLLRGKYFCITSVHSLRNLSSGTGCARLILHRIVILNETNKGLEDHELHRWGFLAHSQGTYEEETRLAHGNYTVYSSSFWSWHVRGISLSGTNVSAALLLPWSLSSLIKPPEINSMRWWWWNYFISRLVE